jgi:CheY-like chemotaxis protein
MVSTHPTPSATISDIKDTSKRTSQLGAINLFIALCVTVLNLYLKNYLTVKITAILSVVLIVMLYLNFRKIRFVKPASVLTINLFLMILVLAEGFRSGCYLYFFPAVAGLPLIFENTNKHTPKLKLYVIFTALCFGLSIYLCNTTDPWEVIDDTTYSIMFYINMACAFSLCVVYSYLNVYFERKYANALIEEKNRTHEAMNARTKFLSSIGHELRTPLNGITGIVNILRGKSTLPEQEQDLDILKYCADHMLELVNDLLDFNKIEAGKFELHPENFNVAKLLHKAQFPFYNRFAEKKIELVSEIDPLLDKIVFADDVRMVQIINNLLSNALKFTDKGYVKLKAECLNRSDSQISMRLTVKDTGIGIKKEDHHKIFDSFWQVYHKSTRKYSGTGLGLPICRKLLNLMDAELVMESEPGEGTTFSFVVNLPLADVKSIIKAAPAETRNLSGYRILVAEDNHINMAIIRKTLQDWKAEITSCWNGEEALNTLLKDNTYDMVLLDLEMPVMDGYTAVKHIKKLHPEMPVIAFTAALIDSEMYQNLINTGFNECVLKPFRPQELFSKIYQQLNVQAAS